MDETTPKYVPIIVETKIDPGLLLNGIKYYKVDSPAILDHAMESRPMHTRKCHIDEFRQSCKEAAVVYIREITRNNIDPEGVYYFRYSDSITPLSTKLVESVTIGKVQLNAKSFKPMFPITAVIDTDNMASLREFWGRDEAARQLGEQLLQALEEQCKSKAA